MPHQLRTLQDYKPEQIRQIMSILVRASGGRKMHSKMVEQSLLEIILAIGLATDGTEESRLWQEFSSEDPSNKPERDGYLQLARADNPFELARRDRRFPGLLSRSSGLRRFARRRRNTSNSQAPIWRADWSGFSAEEQAEILLELALARQVWQQYGTPGKTGLLVRAAESFGLDVKSIKARAKKDIMDKQKPKKKAEKKSKKKGAKKNGNKRTS